MQSKRTAWCLMALAVCLSGCATLNQRRVAAAREELNVENTRDELKRLQARVEAIEVMQQRISQELEAMKTSSDRGKQDLGGRVTALEQAVKALDLSREADKNDILKFMQSLAATPTTGGSAPVRVQAGGEHVVQKGETLSKIATAYKTTVDAIVKANNLKDAHSLREGQKLVIPGREGAKAPSGPDREAR